MAAILLHSHMVQKKQVYHLQALTRRHCSSRTENSTYTLTDNGLNIDPTTADAWTFLATSGSEATNRSSVSTDSDLNPV